MSQIEGKLAIRRGGTQKPAGPHLTLVPASIFWHFDDYTHQTVYKMYLIVTVGEDYYSSSILQTINTKTGGTKTRKAPKAWGWGRYLAFPEVRATDSLCSPLHRAVTSLGERHLLGILPPRSSDLFSTPVPLVGGGRMAQALCHFSPICTLNKSRMHPGSLGMCGSICPLRDLLNISWVDGA